MTSQHHLWLLLGAATLAAVSMLLYRVLPSAAVALGTGSGTVAIIVAAHLVVLAAIIAPIMALRRHSRGRKT